MDNPHLPTQTNTPGTPVTDIHTQPSPLTPPQKPSDTIRRWRMLIWILVILCVAVGIFSYITYTSRPAAYKPPLLNLTPMKGALISDIPAALLIDPHPQIIASGKTFDTKNNQDVLAVSFNTTLGSNQLTKSYNTYFKANNWSIATTTTQGNLTYYFATNATTSQALNLTIVSFPNFTSQVSINIRQPYVQ